MQFSLATQLLLGLMETTSVEKYLPTLASEIRNRWKTSIAGQTGIVHGETTPSVTKVEGIGDASEDYAIAVMVEGQREALWFAENVLEFVDHQPGTVTLIIRDKVEWRRKLALTPRNNETQIPAPARVKPLYNSHPNS